MSGNGWSGAPKCSFPLCWRPCEPSVEGQGVAHAWSRFCRRHGGGPMRIIVTHEPPTTKRRRWTGAP